MTLYASTDDGWQNELSKRDHFIDTASLESLAVISFAGLFEEACGLLNAHRRQLAGRCSHLDFGRNHSCRHSFGDYEFRSLPTSPKFIRTSLLHECHRKAPVASVKAADCTNQIQHRRKQTTLPLSVSLPLQVTGP